MFNVQTQEWYQSSHLNLSKKYMYFLKGQTLPVIVIKAFTLNFLNLVKYVILDSAMNKHMALLCIYNT